MTAAASAIPLPHSAGAYARALRVMPGGNTRSTAFEAPHPVYIAAGEGPYLRDLDGRTYLDFQNNFTALIHGHCHEETRAALERQLALGTCFSNPTLAEIELAELLCERVPHFDQLRFTNTGTEAVMTAIKAARALTGKSRIAKCEGAYHGSYDLVEVSLDPTPQTWGEPTPNPVALNRGTPPSALQDVIVLPFNNIGASEAILQAALPDLAGVLIDPMPSRMGLVDATPAYLEFLCRFTRRHGVALISDEVLNFRRGYSGAADALGFTPDITAFGKIIGGGLPIGAIAGRSEAMSVFDPSKGKPRVAHAGTFTANPLSMVAGRAAMTALTPAVFERLDALGASARERLSRTFEAAGIAGQVTGRGSLFLLHLKAGKLVDYRSAYRSPQERARLFALVRQMREQGVLLSPIGLGALSTAMGPEHIDHLAEAFGEALARLE